MVYIDLFFRKSGVLFICYLQKLVFIKIYPDHLKD
jgi:hypothetical protein